MVERPDPAELRQHLCLDKAYDNPTGEIACEAGGCHPVEAAALPRSRSMLVRTAP